MFHLSPIERYEFAMLKQFIPSLSDFYPELKEESASTLIGGCLTGTST
jgi:hypothetical protein